MGWTFMKCQELGIEPLVTIYHFDCPLHLANEYDGWVSRHTLVYQSCSSHFRHLRIQKPFVEV